MFENGFPPWWSALRKLIWMRGTAFARLVEHTVSGTIASFTTALAKPLRSLLVTMNPIQSGTGDPSPENVRPISGRTEIDVWREVVYDTSADPVLTIALNQTIYGGTVDVVTGKAESKYAKLVLNTANMNNAEQYPGWRDLTELSPIIGKGINRTVEAICNVGGNQVGVNTTASTYDILYLPVAVYGKTQSEWKALAMDIEILLHYATPITITFTPQQLKTLKGTNNVWSDGGDVTVTYLDKN